MSRQNISPGERLILHTRSGPETTNISMYYILVPLKCFEEHGRYLREKTAYIPPRVSEPWPEAQHLHRATEQNNLI